MQRCPAPPLRQPNHAHHPATPGRSKPCDSRDLQANTSLRELMDRLAAAQPALLDLTRQHQEAAAAAAAAAEPAEEQQRKQQQPGRKRARQQQQQRKQQQTSAGGHGAVGAPVGRRTRSAATRAAPARDQAGVEIEEIDLAGDTTSASEAEASSASDASSCSDSEGGSDASDGSLSTKRQRGVARRPNSAKPGGGRNSAAASVAPAPAPADVPVGFVSCPVCSKAVPAFYINSHVDVCLAGAGTSASTQPRGAGGGGGRPAGGTLQQQPAQEARQQGPFEPLAVPAKLVPNLTTEKSLRQLLRRYCLPADGKKKVGLGAGPPRHDRRFPLDQYAAWLLSSDSSHPFAGSAGAVHTVPPGSGDGQ